MHTDELQKWVLGKTIKKVYFKSGMSGHDTWVDKIEFNDGSFLSFKIVPSSSMIGDQLFKDWTLVEEYLRIFAEKRDI